MKADSTDGTFWISFEDLCLFFERIQICKYVDYFAFSGAKVSQGSVTWALASVRVRKRGPYTFSMSQVSDRLFPRDSTYKFSNTRFILFSYSEAKGSVEYVAAAQGIGDRDTYIELEDLGEGTYLLFADTAWLWEGREFSFSSYGAASVEFRVLENFKLSRIELLTQGFLSRVNSQTVSDFET